MKAILMKLKLHNCKCNKSSELEIRSPEKKLNKPTSTSFASIIKTMLENMRSECADLETEKKKWMKIARAKNRIFEAMGLEDP